MRIRLKNELKPASTRTSVLVAYRREALVKAAIEVFSEKGYHSTKVSEIAERAGVSQGSVYNYVRSKEDLLFLVCMDNLDGYERIVLETTEKSAPGLARLRALLHATVHAVFAYKEHHLVKVRELHHLDDSRRREVFTAAARSRSVCEEVLKKAADEAGVDVPNLLLAANVLIFLPNLIFSRAWDFRKAVTEDEVEAFLVDFMWRGLGFPDAGNETAVPDLDRAGSTASEGP
jgi:TetR/AcrR family transcriptional regulator, cholesterol catabolism regulator